MDYYTKQQKALPLLGSWNGRCEFPVTPQFARTGRVEEAVQPWRPPMASIDLSEFERPGDS